MDRNEVKKYVDDTIVQMKGEKRAASMIPDEATLTDDLDMYDVNNDGLIDKEELRQYMKNSIFGIMSA